MGNNELMELNVLGQLTSDGMVVLSNKGMVVRFPHFIGQYRL